MLFVSVISGRTRWIDADSRENARRVCVQVFGNGFDVFESSGRPVFGFPIYKFVPTRDGFSVSVVDA